jgi:Predicted membrane protein (DUF2306)
MRRAVGAPRFEHVIRRVGWAVLTFLSLVIVAVSAQYFRFDPNLYFDQQRAIYVTRQAVLYLHITGAVMALMMLPVQFAAFIRNRWPRTHRMAGRLYVAGCLTGGVGGLALSTTAYGGPVASLGFAALAIAWMSTTAVALRAILARDVPRHRRWMILSGSLTFAAVTLRLYLGTYVALSDAGVLTVSFAHAYAAIAWLAWIPNLAVAWWLTGPGGSPGKAAARHGPPLGISGCTAALNDLDGLGPAALE